MLISVWALLNGLVRNYFLLLHRAPLQHGGVGIFWRFCVCVFRIKYLLCCVNSLWLCFKVSILLFIIVMKIVLYFAFYIKSRYYIKRIGLLKMNNLTRQTFYSHNSHNVFIHNSKSTWWNNMLFYITSITSQTENYKKIPNFFETSSCVKGECSDYSFFHVVFSHWGPSLKKSDSKILSNLWFSY